MSVANLKVAIIGTGKVGSKVIPYLMENKRIKEIGIINRKKVVSDGLVLDLAPVFPKSRGKPKHMAIQKRQTSP